MQGVLKATAIVFAIILFVEAGAKSAQAADALTGQVTSAEEGAMEGVLVNARKQGSFISITVVSDAQGRYAFPAGRLDPGRGSTSKRRPCPHPSRFA